MNDQLEYGRTFEIEVRRIARLLWPTYSYQGASIQAGQERDAVIVTDDSVHIIEATILRTKQKAVDDIDKTVKLVIELRKKYPDKTVKGWFITRDDLTADQMDVARIHRGNVNAMPYKDFLAKLIDARSYLTFREKRSFGSVADPITNHFDLPRTNYVAPHFFDETTSKNVDLNRFAEASTADGARTVLLGDFGAGKSMALRELFFRSAVEFYQGKSRRFPIYLNLRNHIGQDSPVEALIREATNTGYDRYDDLVKAWRADLVFLILDGFDELVTPAWTQKATHLREHRAACTRLVSQFVNESPASTPILIAGRYSYFGSAREMERALKLPAIYGNYKLNDFTKAQATELLRKMQLGNALPDWLPSRPLLLGYIAAYAARKSLEIDIREVEPAEGWDHLLDRVCEREADIQKGLYPEYIRRLLERLATKARYSQTITAPINQTDISAAFREIFERDPDESNLGMIMRLPGLVAAESQRDDRRFIDTDFANVCAGGDIFEFVITSSSADAEPFQQCRANIDELGADFVLSKMVRNGHAQGVVQAALETVSQRPRLSVLKGDMLVTLSASDAVERDRWTIVDDASIENLDLRQSPTAFKKIRLSHAAIATLEIDEANLDGVPQLSGCLIDVIRGPNSDARLKSWLNDSMVGRFDHQELTNKALLDLDLPKGLKVGLTALRKLYLQPGGGRQENAFSRGISSDLKLIVEEVLETLVSHGYASHSNRSGERVYVKNSDKTAEVHGILNMRSGATGELVEALRAL